MSLLTRATALMRSVVPFQKRATAVPIDGQRGWWDVFSQPPGNFQHDIKIRRDEVLESPALFSCMTLIASDISKLRLQLVELQPWGGWIEVSNPAFSPVLRKPNRYQNHIQFKECWMLSKLIHGNTVALKQRDDRGIVTALYILDWQRVKPLVGDDGSIYYQLSTDNLTGLTEDVIVPAREVIHDRFNCLFHPLVGLSPIFANGLPALQALNMGRNSSKFFGNNAQPGGILTAPGTIPQAAADRIKATWEKNYSGINAGKVAVLGDDLKYHSLSPTAVDNQVIQQLGWSAETIAGTLHVPAYKINVGAMPTSNNVNALHEQYYEQCLQGLMEQFEAAMDEGLGLDTPTAGRMLGTWLDTSGLLRMDEASKVKAMAEAIGAGFMKINEARARFDLPPVEGGDSPYLQQQNYSLEALAKRDSQADPFATTAAAPPADAPPAPDNASKEALAEVRKTAEHVEKLGEVVAALKQDFELTQFHQETVSHLEEAFDV